MKHGAITIALLIATAIPMAAQRYDNYCPPTRVEGFTQSTLPIVKITVDGKVIQRRESVAAQLTIIDNGAGQVNYVATGSQKPIYDGQATVKYTGNSTFTSAEKKSYTIEAGNRRWELKADAADRSMVRNLLAAELASGMGARVADSRLCELTIDGTYYGVYRLTQPIDSLLDSGDMVVSVDRRDSKDLYQSTVKPVTTSGNPISWTSVNYHIPASGDAASRIASIESALGGTSWGDVIDVTSWADYVLTAEVAHNADSYRLHAAMRLPVSGKATMLTGDAALGFGNYDAFESFRSDTWVYAVNDILAAQDEPQLVPFYWYNLTHNADFQTALRERWAEYRTKVYTSANIGAIIDRHIALLKSSGALERNEQAWGVWGRKLWPNYYRSTSIDDEVRYLKEWIGERLAWMDANVGREEVVEPADPSARTEIVPVTIASGFNTDCVAESRLAAPMDKNLHPALDGHGSVLVTASMANGGKGIPDDGVLTVDNGHTFRFGDFSQNNALYLDRTGASGTLTFDKAVKADSLCVLLVGTNRENYELKYNVTVRYADGTTEQIPSMCVSDWCVEAYGDFVCRNLTRWRADYNGGGIDNTRVNLSEGSFKVNSKKAVTGLTFTSECVMDAWGYGMVSVFGISALSRVSSGIDDIDADLTPRTIQSIWSVTGTLRTSLAPGINIVRYTDGTTARLLVR